MEVRRASVEDARGIAAVHVASYRAAHVGLIPDEHLAGFTLEKREAAWRQSLERGEATVLVAHEGVEVLGWFALGPSRDPAASSRTGEVWAMCVTPARWRQGVGRALWQAAQALLVAGAYDEVTLWALKDGERALAFYRALGFADDPETRTVQRGGKDLREVRLRRRLPPPAG